MWNPLDGLSTVNVGFRKLHSDAKIPTYGSDEAAGAELYALDKWLIHPKSRSSVAIRTGIAIQLPKGFEAQVRPRSGLALKHGITVLNTPGTIDSDYRGELSVILYNTSQTAFMVNRGDRIAQLVIVPVFWAKFQELNELGSTERGDRGFGSTGT
jgi:dUTP pyrophosphatase